MTDDFYTVLGVAPDASREDVLKAYRERAAELHPDVSDDPDAGEAFQRLNRAKAVLTDPEKRRAYDRLGHERFLAEHGGADDSRNDTEPPRSRSHTERATGSSTIWPDRLGSLVESSFTDRSVGRGHPKGDRFAAGAVRSVPFTVDLSAYLRHRRSAPRSREPAANRPGHGQERRECPKCRGRGTFIHDIDTGRGRRRRLEDCERCGGTGAVSK